MPRTVLVVDDERDTNDILVKSCAGSWFRSDPRSFRVHGRSRRVAEQKPDLILLDLTLPDVDGFEFCDQLKRNSRNQLDSDRHGHGARRCHNRAAGVQGGCQWLSD